MPKPIHELRDAHAAAATAGGHFNELDPHGASAHQGHHHVVSIRTLQIVLGLLLLFTALTVGAAQFEVFVQGYLDILLPRWVNVFIAMSIATVKAALVLLFFMQLKNDNPINGAIFVLCVLGVGLFLGFTALDLFTRDRIYAYKAQQIVAGGTGNTLTRVVGRDAEGKPIIETITGPITAFARDKKLSAVGEAEFKKLKEEAHAHKHHGHDGPAISTADKTVRRTGRTDALAAAPAHGESGDHGDSTHDKAGDHADTKPAAAPH